MFLSVDKGYLGGKTFNFPQKYEKVATNFTADLGSYLHFKDVDLVLVKCFMPEGTQKAIDSPWDEKMNRSKSIQNVQM